MDTAAEPGIEPRPVQDTTSAEARAQQNSTYRELETELVITGREIVANGVVALTLADPEGKDLPEWNAGAHIDLLLSPSLVRQYSLCGDLADRRQWRVGVLLDPKSRGGSRFVHDELRNGVKVRIRGPRNHFPLISSPRYLFLAGGIGITPILAMVAAAEAVGADWRLVYGGRTRASMAFVDELERYGERVALCPDDEQPMDLDSTLTEPGDETLVYTCGPEGLIAAVEEACKAWPAGSVQVERFAAKAPSDPPPETLDSFEVECRRSGLTVTVPADRSIYQVVEEADVDVLGSCLEGICGTCECAVLDGQPDHRDSVLTDAEKQSGNTILICVSRSLSERLVLDI
jgi:ferredoxin-NADP reductase